MKSNVHEPAKMQQAQHSARRAATSHWVTMFARFGYAAKGVVYLIIGALAVELAAGRGGAATDQRGALRTIYEQPFGKFLLIVVAIGLIAFALWSFIQALFDTEGKGKKAKGILGRVGYAVIGISYGLLGARGHSIGCRYWQWWTKFNFFSARLDRKNTPLSCWRLPGRPYWFDRPGSGGLHVLPCVFC